MDSLRETEPANREDRFAALADYVRAPLSRYALRRTDPDTAQDVVAEALLVLWRRIDDVPVDDPLPWCYGVARRCLANAQRAGRRQLRLIEKLAWHQQVHSSEEPALIDRDLAAALQSLSDSDREVVRLWAWEELQPREMAVVLGITANAASIRLHRARRKLSDILQRKTPDDCGQEQFKDRRQP